MTDTEVKVDHLVCDDCGLCASVCPTGAIQYERFGDLGFVTWIDRVNLEKDCTVVIGNERALHRLWWKSQGNRFANTVFMEHPNWNALSLMQILYVFSKGAARLVLLQQKGRGQSVLTSQAQAANQIIQALFSMKDFVQMFSTEEALENLKLQAHSPLPYPWEQQGGLRTRRPFLCSILSFLLEASNKEAFISSSSGADSFGELECDPGLCTQCLSCINECRAGALEANEAMFCLTFLASACVQCGICTKLCPENALVSRPGLYLQKSFFKRRILTKAEPARCARCGKVFGTRASLEKVKSILGQRQDLDVKLFDYCEDCRVKLLFEKQGG